MARLNKGKGKKKRLQFDADPELLKEIDKAQTLSKSVTVAEVQRKAFRLLNIVLMYQNNGYQATFRKSGKTPIMLVVL